MSKTKKTLGPNLELATTSVVDLASNYLYFIEFIRSASPETIRSYRLDLSQAFGKIGPTESFIGAQKPTLSDPETQALLNQARQAQSRWGNLMASSRNRKAAALKSFFQWLLAEKIIDRDLASQIHAARIPKLLPHFLSVDEAVSLLKSLETESGRQQMNRALVLLLYGGGLRISEACGLRWNQVSTDGRVLRLTGKGGKERIVALPALAAKALLVLRPRAQEDSPVFHLPGSTDSLSVRTGYEIVRQAGLRAGLVKPLHPHALRHSFATHLLADGANLRVLQELLGHSTLQATSRYTHLGLDQLAQTLENFHPFGNSKDK